MEVRVPKSTSTPRIAIVYTTVRKEEFLTFLFTGNSREKVEQAARSMATLKFAP